MKGEQVMLPDFPKIKRKLEEEINLYLKQLIRQDSLFSQIREEHHFEGNRMSTKYEDGIIDSPGYEKISSEFRVKREDIITKGPGAFVENIQKMAESMKDKKAKLFFERIKEITEATGQVVNGKGQPITFEKIMELFEKMLIDFDDQGNPNFPTLVLSPKMEAEVKAKWKEWQENPEYKIRFKELIEQKRKEWNDRESNRKLVD